MGTGQDHPVSHGIKALLSLAVSPAAERLRYILGEDDELPNPTLFTEMDTLQHDGDEMEWKESARSGGIWERAGEKIPSQNIPVDKWNQGMSIGFSGVKKRTFPSQGNVGKMGF